MTTSDTETPSSPAPAHDSTDEVAKWKELAQKHEKRARENAEAAKRLEEIEEQGKSDLDKATERVAQAEQRAAAAEQKAARLEVAMSKGLTAAQARRLVGNNVEELEADADDLLTNFKPAESDTPTAPPSPRPTEPTGGTDPTQDKPIDIRSVVDSIPRD